MTQTVHPKRSAALSVGAVLLLVCLLATGAAAAERETLCSADYCFQADDFTAAGDVLTGIFVTDVPSATVGSVRYGSRTLRAGDVLPAEVLSSLTLTPACTGSREATVGYLPITPDGLGAAQTVGISILSDRNEAPTAADSRLETYKNVANGGTLNVTDPEGGSLEVTLVSDPKRGTVEFSADGAFTYTPAKNKVGKDSFTYTVTDEAGNVSNEATVEIEILKPMDKVTYSDMAGDPDQFTAMWLRDNGIFSGESVAGVACFSPEKTVARGEFLVMVARLTGLEPDDAAMTSGFADEGTTPQWMRPYIVSALRSGMISGVNSEEGLVFRPTEALTSAEAAVMLQNVLHLPGVQEASALLGEDAALTWAADSVAALSEAGIPVSCSGELVTRREASRMLYAAAQLLNEA